MDAAKVWDIPTRLFHWSLVLLIIALWVTTEEDLYYDMEWHMYFGYAVLALLLFRICWGICGSTTARFWHFLYSPVDVWNYAKRLFKRQPSYHIGHNPIGGLSVFALLASLAVQVGTGLFSDDDIFTEGPLNGWVSNDMGDFLTSIHHTNSDILLILIGVHLAAVLFYLLYKRENLIRAMVTGYKQLPNQQSAKTLRFTNPLWALLTLLVSAGAVYVLVFVVA